jgi:hypothetical protein
MNQLGSKLNPTPYGRRTVEQEGRTKRANLPGARWIGEGDWDLGFQCWGERDTELEWGIGESGVREG